jgi:hypothetical protein
MSEIKVWACPECQADVKELIAGRTPDNHDKWEAV